MAGRLIQSLADGLTQPPLGIIWSHGVNARRSPEDAENTVKLLISERQSRYVPSSLFATAFLTLGDLAKAFTSFERAAAERDPFLPLILMDPALEPLRAEPTLGGILQTAGLSAGRQSVGACIEARLRLSL